ncbi:unnamed protein product [Arabidopsis thaliana]|uniref:(thale cress) hypothetical protein n=1 Tax=Arabidopsis thaliana TaxID=3702 RepID=A0A7G2EK84_ARATH|nr:unnamed protein product [Arabidopsis thaliana]
MQVAEKDILHKMVKMAKRKPNIQVKEKILILIDTWQESFSGPQGRHPQYYAAYQELLRAGIVFPQRPQITPSSGQNGPSTRYPQNSRNARQEAIDTSTESEFPTLSLTEIQNARGIMDVLAEMMNAIDGNNKEGLKQEVVVDLVSQCRTYKQRVVHLVNSTSDESMLCQGLALNDDLQRLLAKHEAIASGNSMIKKEEKSKKEVPKDTTQIIDVGSSETKNGSVVAYTTNGPKIDLLSGDDFETPNADNSLALVPLGPPQPSSPVAKPDNSIVLIDMLSDNNCESSTPTSNPHANHQMVQQNYSNGFGPGHQEQSYYGQGSSAPVWNLQITQQPSSPAYGNQPFSPNFSPPASPHYGGQNNNVLALPPPPWEAQSPSSSPQYSPTHPMQVTQVVITTHTHQPLGYNPQGGSPHATNNNNNNMFGMFLPPMTGGHMPPPFGHNGHVTNNNYNPNMYGGYGGQAQPPQQYLVEQQMYGMSLQDNGNNNTNPYQVSSHQPPPMMKPMNKKPEDKLFGDLVELSKFKKPTSGRAGNDSISPESISLDTLASIRSLIINADTSDSVISSVFDFLTGLLSRGDSAILHHVLKLLSDLSFRRKELAPQIFDSILSNLLRLHNAAAEASHGRAAVESLAVLASLSERNPSIYTALYKIDAEVFASICLGAPISSRLWLLRNAERFKVPSSVLFTLFLGFSKDPYPYIRKVALDGLINICNAGDFNHAHAVEGCYTRAVELLSDAEDIVRSSAVRAVSVWGKVMIASKEEEMNRRDCIDAVFLQLCSVVRDMSVDVRVEVFKAFGIIGTASESIILQTLSKKVLGAGKGKKPQNLLSNGSADVSSAAGVYIHGFEDEFYKVREAAVDSFHSLSVNSIKFPDEAVYLLMDMLYDDYMVVRLKALKALHHIADLGNLKIQETYMPAFLDAIVDTSENIRVEARNILKLAKLPDLKLVNKCIDGVLKSLEMYPQDEPDILSALFHFGQNHTNFLVSMVKRFSEKLGTASGSKAEFNRRQLSASLTLIISAPLSNKQSITSIPPLAFSYSLAMLGKFSSGLHDMMDQDMLLAYLTHCAILSSSSGTEFNKGDVFFHAYRDSNADLAGNPVLLPGCLAVITIRVLERSTPSIEGLQTGVSNFDSRFFNLQSSVEVELLMEEVEIKLMEIRCRFTGLSTEESLVLELVIFGCLLRLYKFEICCRLSCMEKLSSTISQLELHHEQQCTKPSDFLTETKKSLEEFGSSDDINSCRLLDLIKIFKCFSPEQFTFSVNLQCVSAEVEVPGNGPYSPISFVPGLPVAIPCEITLLNVPRDTCLWLRISRNDETCQFVYLDPNLYNGNGREKRFMFTAVTYMTPRAVVFTLRVSIGIECLFEDICYRKQRHGPKHPVAYLCILHINESPERTRHGFKRAGNLAKRLRGLTWDVRCCRT